jgi:hypothetical protein
MKKTLKVVVFCMIFTFSALTFTSPAKANDNSGMGFDLIVQPMNTNIITFTNDFYISGSGLASLNSYLSIRDADMGTVNVYLEKFSNGYWSSIASWTGSSYTGYTNVNQSYQITSSGQYRMRSSAFAYKGSTIVEMSSYVSSIWTY